MIRLDTTSRKLTAVLDGGTTGVQYTVSYSDKTSSAYTGATALSVSNGTTPVDILAAPGASTIRDIDYVIARNTSGSTRTVTITLDNSGTGYQQVSVALAAGSSLSYTHAGGWRVTDATGGFVNTGVATIADGDKGDITVSSSGSVWTIDNDAVTYAKMQNVSATSRVLGRKTSGAGDTEECTLSEVLDFIGSAAQGDILYRDASAWARLGAGTSGHYLQTQGAAANPQWAAVSAGSSYDFIHLRDEKTSGTAGGTFTSGSFVTRTLNTEVTDTGGHCTLSSNQFTLAAGTYNVLARAPGRNCDLHKLKLRNTSDSTDTIIGASSKSNSGAGNQVDAWLLGRFTIASTKTFELQHRCSSTATTDGLGEPSGFSVTEVYAEVFLTKVA